MANSPAIQRLLDELERLPGIGPKSASRIAYWMLNNEEEKVLRLADAIVEVKQQVKFCSCCFNYAEDDLCSICMDPTRDMSRICVVSEPRDIAAIERTHSFRGRYHVLGGVLSPIEGIGPDELHITELMARLSDPSIEEVILAFNCNVEGETTAAYIARLIKPLQLSISKLASGLPVGGDLEYADEATLGRAISSRMPL